MHDDKDYTPPVDEPLEDMMQRLTGIDIKKCPKCGNGRMARIIELLPEHIDYILPVKKEVAWNTS